MSLSPLPLEGVRVLEITTAWAGPMLGRILRDFGAEVVKIESLHAIDNWRGAVTGDDRARYPQGEPGDRPYNRSAWFNTQNIDKFSLGLDLKSPAARPAVESLVRSCDIVISNFAAGALARMQLDYESLLLLRPDIILVEMVVAGEGGPLANTRGVGPTMEALAGMTMLTGYDDGVPQRTGPAYVDPIGALNGAMATLLAVYHRQRTGQGQRIELAQCEALLHWYGERALLYANDRLEIRPNGNTMPDMAPHDAYRASGEDQWVAIAMLSEAEWPKLCLAMQRPELAADHRFQTGALRARHAQALRGEIETWTLQQDKHAVAATLQAHGVCAAPVCSGEDVYHDPQLAANGFLLELDHAEAGRHRYQGLPFRFAHTTTRRYAPAPLLGQHTDAILRDWAGLDDNAIAHLHEGGVIVQADTGPLTPEQRH